MIVSSTNKHTGVSSTTNGVEEHTGSKSSSLQNIAESDEEQRVPPPASALALGSMEAGELRKCI